MILDSERDSWFSLWFFDSVNDSWFWPWFLILHLILDFTLIPEAVYEIPRVSDPSGALLTMHSVVSV